MYVYITKYSQYWDTDNVMLNANRMYADTDTPAYTNYKRCKGYITQRCLHKVTHFNKETEKHIGYLNSLSKKYSYYEFINSGDYTREQLDFMKNQYVVKNYASIKVHFYDYKEDAYYEEYIQIDRYKVI